MRPSRLTALCLLAAFLGGLLLFESLCLVAFAAGGRLNGDEVDVTLPPPAQRGAPAPPAGESGPAPTAGIRLEGPVHVIPITGTIDEGLAVFVRRALAEAKADRAVAILVEINTFGGRLDSAVDIKDALSDAGIPVVAFVTQRAWSAGALIALAAPHLAMAPGSSIGAAEPRPADPKIISAVRREFEAAAEKHGRDPRIAGAMVDASIVIPGLVEEGEILTLSAHRARELGFVDFVGMRRAEVLEHFGIFSTRLHEAQPNWAERIARFLTDPVVSSILLTVGFLGLLAEVTSPGWGVPGTAGVVALGLFFGARAIAGLAGAEMIFVFLAGLALIALELFVIPGFGLAGIAGAAAILASIFFSFPDAASAFRALGYSTLATLILAILLFRYLPRTRTWQRIVLQTHVEEAEEDRVFREKYAAGEDAPLAPGRVGRALTPLRPSGTIEVAGERFDAVTEGDWIEAGAPVRVARVEGRRVIVRRLVQ